MPAFTEKITTNNSDTHLPVCKQFSNIESCSKLLKYFVKLQSLGVKDFFSCKDGAK
jgi:hypothetical protein